MKAFSWTCPYCNKPTTITDEDTTEETTHLDIKNKEGSRAITVIFIVCPNPECKRINLLAELWEYDPRSVYHKLRTIRNWQLLPQSKAQTFPDYIPKAIIDDYNEACLIKDLSPKASATLARRCLQGIIRDFWRDKVKAGRLVDEIKAIKEEVDPLTWEAIDAVRSIGNIGAHMEKDVNLIVDIELDEAELLIKLIETLLKDWYIVREQKKSHLEAIIKIEKSKGAKKTKQEKIDNSS